MSQNKFVLDAVIAIIAFVLSAMVCNSTKLKVGWRAIITMVLLAVGALAVAWNHHWLFFAPSAVAEGAKTAAGTTTVAEGEKFTAIVVRLIVALIISLAIFLIGPVKYLRAKTKPEFIAGLSLSLIGVSLITTAFWSYWCALLLVLGYISAGWYTVPIRMRGTPTFHGKFFSNIVWGFGPHWFWVPIWYIGSGMILTPYESVNKKVETDWLQTKATRDPNQTTPHGAGAAIRVKYILYAKVGVNMARVLAFTDHTAATLFDKVKELVDAWLDSELKAMDYDHALNNITNHIMPDSVKADIFQVTGCVITTFKVWDRDPDPLLAEIYSKTVAMEAEQRQLELQKILGKLRGEVRSAEETALLEGLGKCLKDDDNIRAFNYLRDMTLVRSDAAKWVMPSDIAKLASLITAKAA